jgi:redox-sensing transcriptional repressor
MTNMVKPGHRIPEATVARLPVYLRSLLEVAEEKTTTISSERLADMAGVNAAKVRKDLSYLGSYGTRGVGYDVQYLLYQISRQLGLNQDRPVVIVGVGNLGHALANYGGFLARGFRVLALIDADPAKVGERIGDLKIRSIDDLDELVRGENATIGVITTPEKVAQEVADRLVAAGVTSILNFAPSVLTVPPHVSLRKVDLSIELQILSFYQQRAGTGALPGGDPPATDLPSADLPGHDQSVSEMPAAGRGPSDRPGTVLPGPERRGADRPGTDLSGPDRRGPGAPPDSALAGQSG